MAFHWSNCNPKAGASATHSLSVGNNGNQRQLGLGYGLALKRVTHFKIKCPWDFRLVQGGLQMMDEMACQGKGLAPEPDSIGLIPKTYLVGGKSHFSKVVF